MALKQNKKVVFDELTHTYFNGDKQLIGVTSLMKKHGLSPDYGGVDPEVLAHAAELGTQAHQTIEAYCGGLPVVQTPLIKTFIKLGLNVAECEWLISDNKTVASSIDLLCNGDNEGEYILVDMKRTSTVHKDALEWQLGIYKYLFEKQHKGVKVVACACLPIKKGNKDDIEADTCSSLVPITPRSEDEVKELIKCEEKGILYQAEAKEVTSTDVILSQEEKESIVNITRGISEFSAQVKMLEESIEEYKSKLYDYMLEKNIDEIGDEASGLTIKLKRPYQSSRLDSTKLKKDKPDLYEEYCTTKEVKGSVSFTIK